MKRLIFLLILGYSILALGQSQVNIIDAGNSTTTNLGSGKTFTGVGYDLIAQKLFASISVYVTSNKASATGGLKIQFSTNNSTFYTSDSATISANTPFTLFAKVKARYYRVVYVNTTDSITANFSIQTILHEQNIEGDSIKVFNSIPQSVKVTSLPTSDTVTHKVSITGANTVSVVKTFEVQSMVANLDSMNNADTVKIHYFGHNYMDCFFTLYDSTGTTDTFYVERRDTLSPYSSKEWTSVQCGFIDIGTGAYTSSVTGKYQTGANVIIPGAGLTKTYYIAEPRPGTYRIWVPSYVTANNKKRYVKWTGKNR